MNDHRSMYKQLRLSRKERMQKKKKSGLNLLENLEMEIKNAKPELNKKVSRKSSVQSKQYIHVTNTCMQLNIMNNNY